MDYKTTTVQTTHVTTMCLPLVLTSISKKNSHSFQKKIHNYNYKGYPASCRIAFSIT